MELVVQEMWNFCRFCLSQDEDLLIPIRNALDEHVTVDNIERFTGIAIEPDENIHDAICTDCSNRLYTYAVFRRSCLRNDAYLRKIYPQMCADDILDEVDAAADNHSTDPCVNRKLESVVPKASSSQATSVSEEDEEEEEEEEEEEGEEGEEEEEEEGYSCFSSEQPTTQSMVLANPSPPPSVDRGVKDELVEEELYSANYIAPGEDLDDDARGSSDDDSFIAEMYNAIMRKPQRAYTQSKVEQEYISNEMYHLLDLSKYRRQRYLCEMCGKMVSDIVSHIVSHKQEARYACPHCPVRMTHSANMMRHVQAVHERRIVKTCKPCGKGFTHKNGYDSHMLSHHGIGTQHECKVCGKMFNHRSSMREHIRRYHEMESYSCSLCDKTFKMRRALQNHQLVHSTERPYACPRCPKQFKSAKTRATHLRTHSGIQYKCTLCDKSYRYKALLNIHRRKMHPTEDLSNE